MTFTSDKLKQARDAGYSDDEIWGFFSQQDDRFNKAKEAGYSLDEVSGFFSQKEKQPEGIPVRKSDPVKDYESSVSVADRLAKTQQEGIARYNELAQQQNRTPEVVAEMVKSFNAAKEAEINFYKQKEQVDALRPKVDAIVAQQQKEETAAIEGLGKNPDTAPLVPQLLGLREQREAKRQEILQSIADPEERDKALKQLQVDYVSGFKGSLEAIGKASSDRMARLDQVAGALKASDEEKQKELKTQATLVAADVPEPLFAPKEMESARLQKIDDSLADLPPEQREQYKKEAQLILDLASGRARQGIVNNRLEVSPSILFDDDAVNKAIDESQATDVQREAFQSTLPQLRNKVAEAEIPALSQWSEFNDFVKENNLQDASAFEKVSAFKNADRNWFSKAGMQTKIGLAQANESMIGQIQATVGSGLYAYQQSGLATDPDKVYKLSQAFAAAAGDQQQNVEDLGVLSQAVGGPTYMADIANTGYQMAPLLLSSFGVGLASSGVGIGTKLASNIAFAAASGAAGLQSYASVYMDATETIKDRLIQQSMDFAERQLLDRGVAPEDARKQAQSQAMSEDKAREAAMRQAYLPSIISGLSTATITALGGKFGPEAITREAAISLGKNQGYKQAVKGFLKDVAINAGVEIPEETADQFVQGVTEKLTYNPEKTMGDVMVESLYAGGMGAIFGAGGGVIDYVATKTANRLADQQTARDEELKRKQSEIDDALKAAQNASGVAPASADAVAQTANQTQANVNQEAAQKGISVEDSGKKPMRYPATFGPFAIKEGETEDAYWARIDAIASETPDQRVARLKQEAKAAAGITLEEAPTPEAAQARITEREGKAATPVETPTGTRVEAAAYQAPDGTVYFGASHLDAMAKARDAGKIDQAAIDAKQEVTSRETPEFGFATDKEAFIGRSQAEVVATGSGQMLVDKPATGLLHSNEVSLDAFQEAAKPAQPVIPTGQAVPQSTSLRILGKEATRAEYARLEAEGMTREEAIADLIKRKNADKKAIRDSVAKANIGDIIRVTEDDGTVVDYEIVGETTMRGTRLGIRKADGSGGSYGLEVDSGLPAHGKVAGGQIIPRSQWNAEQKAKTTPQTAPVTPAASPVETAPIVTNETPPPAPEAPTEAAAPTKPTVAGFTTAKGSTYEVTPEGKTVRTKRSEGRGQGETYEPHSVLFVPNETNLSILSDMQGGMGDYSIRMGYSEGNRFIQVTDANQIPANVTPQVAIVSRSSKQIIPNGVYDAQRNPEVGLNPVEKLYKTDGTSSTHLGNQITEIRPIAEAVPAAVEPTPVTPPVTPETPATAETRFSQFVQPKERPDLAEFPDFKSFEMDVRGVPVRFDIDSTKSDENTLYLESFRVPREERRQGIGREAMVNLIKWANENNVTLKGEALTAPADRQYRTPQEMREQGYMTPRELFRFYQSLGWESDPEGPSKTMGIPMVYRPKPAAEVAPTPEAREARREKQLANSLDSGDFVSAQALVDGGATMDRATFLRSITPSATQRATTIHTRLERDGIISKDEFVNEQGLVYGDGRGAASAYLGAESYEPFPPAGFAPDYSGDRVAGQGAPIDKKFQTILNTFVLNVVDPQTRSFIVKDIANLLENGGRAVFVTRGTDVANSKALVSFGPLERIQRSEGKLTYQKGFTQPELIQYLKETLGDGFEVRALRGGSASDVRVEVVKNTDATLNNPPIAPESRERRRVQMGRAGMEPSAVEARLQELGFPTGGIIRVVNQPDADFEGRTIILDGKVTGVELNAAALKDNGAIDRVLNHEFAEAANADGALNRLVENLTPKEKKEINDTITRLRYEERARTAEEAARAIETLAEAWRGRGFFTRAVARVEAWASKLGFKLTRRAAEYIAARNLADINSGFRTAYNQFINVTGDERLSRAYKMGVPTQEELDARKSKLPEYTSKVTQTSTGVGTIEKLAGFDGRRFKIEILDPTGRSAGRAIVVIENDGDTALTIQDTIVYQQFRGKGYGEALYREVAKFAQQNGLTSIFGGIVSEDAQRVRKKLFQTNYRNVEAVDSEGGQQVAMESNINPDIRYARRDYQTDADSYKINDLSKIRKLLNLSNIEDGIVKFLSRDLLDAKWAKIPVANDATTHGHCWVAAEAAYHILGGKGKDWEHRTLNNKGWPEGLDAGETHHFIQNKKTGEIIDPTRSQFGNVTIPYENSIFGGAFMGKTAESPSIRAKALLHRIAVGETRTEVRESRRDPEAIPTFTEGTPEAATLKEMATSMAKVDAASEAKGGKPETYKISEIASVWMDSGLDERALQDAIVEYTNLTPANAQKVAKAINKQYGLQKQIAEAAAPLAEIAPEPEGAARKTAAQRLIEQTTGVRKAIVKVTGSEKALLNKQIQLKAREARETRKARKEAAADLVKTIQDLVKTTGIRGPINSRQSMSLTKKALRLDVNNEDAVDRFIAYAEKVIENANYDRDLADARALIKRSKELAKAKTTQGNIKTILDIISLVPPSMLDNPFEFNVVVQRYLMGLSPVTSKNYAVMPDADMEAYLNSLDGEIKQNQKELDRARMQRKLDSLSIFADERGLTVDEAMTLLESDEYIKAENLAKQKAITDLLNSLASDSQKDIKGYDSTGMTDSQKELVSFMKTINVENLTNEEKRRYVRYTNNLLANGATFGLEQFKSIAKAQNFAIEAAQDKRLSKQAAAWISPVAKWMGENTGEVIKSGAKGAARFFQSEADTIKNTFGSSAVGAIRRYLGIADLDTAQTKSTSEKEKIANAVGDFYKRLKKKFGENSVNTEQQAISAVAGYLIQQEGNKTQEESIQYRRRLMQENIDDLRTSDRQAKLQEAEFKAKALEALTGTTNEEILNNLKKLNPVSYEEVMWWKDKMLPEYRPFLKEHDENFRNQANNYNNTDHLSIFYKWDEESLLPTELDEVYRNDPHSMRIKQAANSIKRIDHPSLPVSKSGAKANIDGKFGYNQYSALVDQVDRAFVAPAWEQIVAFTKTPEFVPLMGGKANADLMKKILLDTQIARSKSYVDDDTSKVFLGLVSFTRRLASQRVLGGFTAPLKQVSDQLIKLISTTGRRGLVFDNFFKTKEANPLLDKFPISRRGDAKAGSAFAAEFNDLARKVSSAISNKRWSRYKELMNKMGEFWMGPLRGSDVWIAKVSWLAYYESHLNKNNIKRESWEKEAQLVDTDKARQEAAQYAEWAVDFYAGASDPSKMAKVSKQSKNGAWEFVKMGLIPLNSFAVQQKSAMISDLRDIFLRTEPEERKAAMAGLAGNIGGMITFHGIRIWLISALITGLGKGILQAVFGIDPEEPDEEKKDQMLKDRWRKFYASLFSNMVAGGLGGVAENQSVAAFNKVSYLWNSLIDPDSLLNDKGEVVSFREYEKKFAPLYRYQNFNRPEYSFGLADILFEQGNRTVSEVGNILNREEMEKYSGNEYAYNLFSTAMETAYFGGFMDADLTRIARQLKQDMDKSVEEREKRLKAIRSGR